MALALNLLKKYIFDKREEVKHSLKQKRFALSYRLIYKNRVNCVSKSYSL